MTRRRGRRAAGRVFAAAGVLVLALALAEGAARLWLRHAASEGQFWEYASLDQLQDTLPGQQMITLCVPWYVYPTPGFRRGANRHNSAGYRGEEIVLPKPAGEFRIVCLGGSTTYDEAIEDYRNAYPALLEKELRARGLSVTVVNAGFPGWSSRETLLNIALRVRYIEPDLLVLYDGFNDLVHRAVWPPSKYQTDYVVPGAPFPDYLLPSLTNDLTLLRILRIRLGMTFPPHTMFAGPSHDHWGMLLADYFEQHRTGAYPRGLFETVSLAEIFRSAPPVPFANNLDACVSLALDQGIGVMLATVVLNDRNIRDLLGSDTEPFTHALAEMNAVVLEQGRKRGVPVYDFASEMPEGDYWADFMHSNEAGAAVKARMFADFIVRNGLAAPRKTTPAS